MRTLETPALVGCIDVLPEGRRRLIRLDVTLFALVSWHFVGVVGAKESRGTEREEERDEDFAIGR